MRIENPKFQKVFILLIEQEYFDIYCSSKLHICHSKITYKQTCNVTIRIIHIRKAVHFECTCKSYLKQLLKLKADYRISHFEND